MLSTNNAGLLTLELRHDNATSFLESFDVQLTEMGEGDRGFEFTRPLEIFL